MDIFLFGTLLYDPLRAIVLGRHVAGYKALCKGWSMERVKDAMLPVFQQNPGAITQGLLLVALTDEERKRFLYYVESFGSVPKDITVKVDGCAQAAQAFAPQTDPENSGQPWHLEDWERDAAAYSCEAAAEIMRAYTRGVPLAVLDKRLPMIWARAASRSRQPARPVTVAQTFQSKSIEIEQETIAYEAFFRVEEYRLTHPLFSGNRSEPVSRAIFHVCDAVTVLPYDPKRDVVLVVEQVRIGAFAKGDPLPWLLEPVAGMIDLGEDEITCGIREAQEEAGLNLEAQNFHRVARYYPSPGGVAQILISYVACTDLPAYRAGLGGEAHEGEDIRAHILPFADLMAMVESGEACNAPLILSAQWIALNKAHLVEFTQSSE